MIGSAWNIKLLVQNIFLSDQIVYTCLCTVLSSIHRSVYHSEYLCNLSEQVIREFQYTQQVGNCGVIHNRCLGSIEIPLPTKTPLSDISDR